MKPAELPNPTARLHCLWPAERHRIDQSSTRELSIFNVHWLCTRPGNSDRYVVTQALDQIVTMTDTSASNRAEHLPSDTIKTSLLGLELKVDLLRRQKGSLD